LVVTGVRGVDQLVDGFIHSREDHVDRPQRYAFLALESSQINFSHLQQVGEGLRVKNSLRENGAHPISDTVVVDVGLRGPVFPPPAQGVGARRTGSWAVDDSEVELREEFRPSHLSLV
jgi:hypothetical protein